MLRVCIKCGIPKELTVQFFRQCLSRSGAPLYFRKKCKDCERVEGCEWQRQHTEYAKERNRKFYEKNPNYKRNYNTENVDKIREYRVNYENQLHVKLKKRVSRRIKHALTSRNARKNSRTLAFLPYSIEELKLHLESQFEPWMNWDNWGVYNPGTWDENDPSTWTWQLDHIKPMATYVYNCQSDPGFKEAWRLDNLRPLRSKDNIVLGAKMKRIKNRKVTMVEVSQ